MKLIVLSLLVALQASCASTYKESKKEPQKPLAPLELSHKAKFFLHPPTDKKLKFSGAIEANPSSVIGNIMYPADTGGVFAASLLAHAITNSAIKSHKEGEKIKKANQILNKYEPAIEAFSFEKLARINHIKSVMEVEDISIQDSTFHTPGWIIGTSPTFILSQDQKSLTLKTNVRISSSRDLMNPRYEREIAFTVFVAPDRSAPEYWLENEASVLYDTGTDMYANVLSIALSDTLGDLISKESTARTFRFRNGEKIRYERGHVLRIDCQRLTIKTLRNSIKSIPIDPSDHKDLLPEECFKTTLPVAKAEPAP